MHHHSSRRRHILHQYARLRSFGVLVVIVAILWAMWFRRPITVNTVLVLREWGTIAPLYNELSRRERVRSKLFFRKHAEQLSSLQVGSYTFSGSYSPGGMLDVLEKGPEQTYATVTILEGWSRYDIDAALSEKELITPGSYISFTADPTIISRYVQRYPFLAKAVEERGELSTLEGYLYPDTYFLDPARDIIDQLVYVQLEAFNTKIRASYDQQLTTLTTTLLDKGRDLRMSSYGGLILASVIEKEEFNDANKPGIASVFLNRLHDGTRLDADISLCYGLAKPYEDCPPSEIVKHLTDSSNPYNTRSVPGLPPTPITSPSLSSIEALFSVTKTANYFYLHAPDGTIYFSETLSEHNAKKSKYLR